MFPNSALGDDSRLRKAIRSTGLKIARVVSDVRTVSGIQMVDVFDADNGSEHKDVPIMRATSEYISFPYVKADGSNTDLLKFGVSVVLGFLEGSRAPVVLGVVNSGGGGSFREIRSSDTRTGEKAKDNSIPQSFEGDRAFANDENASKIILRSADGDISVFVFDIDLDAFNNAKSPSEKEAILQEALSRSPNFDLFLYGAQAAFRVLRNVKGTTLDFENDNERVLNARYWGLYKNTVEYPYIASLAHRIRNIENLLDALGDLMKALKTLAGAGNPIDLVTGLPDLVKAVDTFLSLLTGTNKPSVVRNQLAFGIDKNLGLPSLKFIRDQGGDTFLPLFFYQAMANIFGISTTTINSGDDIDRPLGFGGSPQLDPLNLKLLKSDGTPFNFGELVSQLMEDVEVAPNPVPDQPPLKLKDMPVVLNKIKDALAGAGLNVAFDETLPGKSGPISWESLMSSLIHLGVHYAGTASGSHLGLVEE